MPSEAQHIVKAEHNERFFIAISEGLQSSYGQYHDWVVTVMFYSALHYIDAYLARVWGIHPETHGSRIRSVQRISQLRPVLNYYTALSFGSIEARYHPKRFTEDTFRDFRENNFMPLRRYMRDLLGI